jgi:hypothetical protein
MARFPSIPVLGADTQAVTAEIIHTAISRVALFGMVLSHKITIPCNGLNIGHFPRFYHTLDKKFIAPYIPSKYRDIIYK